MKRVEIEKKEFLAQFNENLDQVEKDGKFLIFESVEHMEYRLSHALFHAISEVDIKKVVV
jgi:hypothetical protein